MLLWEIKSSKLNIEQKLSSLKLFLINHISVCFWSSSVSELYEATIDESYITRIFKTMAITIVLTGVPRLPQLNKK